MIDAVASVEWRVWSYRLPLTRPLHWGGARHAVREGLILGLLHPAEGWRYGEAAPLPGFSPESLDQARADLLALLRGETRDACASAWHALDSAWELGGDAPSPLAVNALVDGPLADLPAAARAARGCAAVKLKCALSDPQAMAARVRRLAVELPSGTRIRVDANRVFPPGEATEFLRLIEDLPVEYVEEPCDRPAFLPRLAELSHVPLALDESLREAPEALPFLLACARALVLKPAWTGRLSESRRLLDFARRNGQTATLSSALESAVGLRNLAALAHRAGLGGGVHGLDTGRLLAADLLPSRVEGGLITFPPAEPDFTLLQEIAHGAHSLPLA